MENLSINKHQTSWKVVAHTFNPSRWISEFQASLVYRVSSRTPRTTQRNPVSETTTTMITTTTTTTTTSAKKRIMQKKHQTNIILEFD